MVPLCDVQGLILRSYGLDCAAFFLLRVESAAPARRSLGTLPITPATLWDQKPPYCINVGLTFDGLAALLGMLNSCASNVTVVNIDNGFGAGYVASLINRL